MKPSDNSFWITNISNKSISLYDLNVTIKAKTSVNLMSKHYSFKLEELEKSLSSGYLYKNKDKLFKRVVPPVKEKTFTLVDNSAIFPEKTRSIFEFKEEKFAELEFTDEQYVAQQGDDDETSNK